MKRSLVTLAVTGLALAAALPVAAQINTSSIPNNVRTNAGITVH